MRLLLFQVFRWLGHHQPCLRTYFEDTEAVLIPRPSNSKAIWPNAAASLCLGLSRSLARAQPVCQWNTSRDWRSSQNCNSQQNGGKLISNAIANFFSQLSGVQKTSERHLFRRKGVFYFRIWFSRKKKCVVILFVLVNQQTESLLLFSSASKMG